MTVRELEARMDSDELSRWVAKEAFDPIPDFYWMAALIASTIAQAMGSKGAKLEHFLPRRKPKPKASRPAILGAIASIRAMAEHADAERLRRES